MRHLSDGMIDQALREPASRLFLKRLILSWLEQTPGLWQGIKRGFADVAERCPGWSEEGVEDTVLEHVLDSLGNGKMGLRLELVLEVWDEALGGYRPIGQKGNVQNDENKAD